MEPGWPEAIAGIALGPLGRHEAARPVGTVEETGSTDPGAGPCGQESRRGQRKGPSADDATGRRADHVVGFRSDHRGCKPVSAG